ncbi:MAG: MFS transporter [Caulobacteraceae bacterium]
MSRAGALALPGDRRQAGLRWRMVAVSWVGLACCQSPIAFLTLGVFMKPLGHAFGWGRGPVSLALSAGAITLAVITPLVGSLIDRVGARKVMIPSMIGFGLLMASLFFLTDSLLHFYAIYLLLGIVGAGANNVAFMRVISAWFNRRRGLALGIASTGVTLGSAGAAYFAQRLIDAYGWRAAYLGLGAFVLLIGVPVVALFIRERPSDLGLEPEEAASENLVTISAGVELGQTIGEALRRPIVWAMIFLGFLIAVSLHGVQIHLVPLLTDRGIRPDVAAGLFTLIAGLTSTVGRMGVGGLFDRFFAPRVAMCAFLLPAIGLAFVLVSKAQWPCYVMVALMGLGSGSESDVLGYLSSRYFGLKAFGQLYGLVFGGFMVGTAIGPWAYGVLYDRTHSYRIAFAISIALILVMCGLLASLPKFPDLTEGESEAGREGALAAPAFD